MFKNFWGSQDNNNNNNNQQQRPQDVVSNDSWYRPSDVSSPSSSSSRPANRPTISSNVSPTEAAGIIAVLKDKNVDELRRILSDKDAYQNFLLSLEPVKTQNRVREELRDETLQLARENLEKEPRIIELRNQCKIIRTTELATAQEKMHELERKKEETLKNCSPSSLLHRLQEAMDKTDEDSEALHQQLLDRELDVAAFVQKYKKMRYTYHKRALTQLAAKTSMSN